MYVFKFEIAILVCTLPVKSIFEAQDGHMIKVEDAIIAMENFTGKKVRRIDLNKAITNLVDVLCINELSLVRRNVVKITEWQ